MAAIFDFSLIRTSDSLRGVVCRVTRPQKHGYSRWNFVAIVYSNWAAFNSVFSAAILDFWLPVSSDSVSEGAIEKFTPENIGVDTGIVFLSRRIAELLGGGNFTTPPPAVRVTKFGPLSEG